MIAITGASEIWVKGGERRNEATGERRSESARELAGALLAAWLPARRLARLDPAVSLRSE